MNATGKTRKHLWIQGRVQGVFFRQSTHRQAHQIGRLTGWVRNLPDGRVEALIEGPPQAVEALVQFCHQGPPAARVDEVEVLEETPTGEYTRFEIRR